MTPKEKAIELVKKYSDLLEFDMPAQRHVTEFKQCALISVDEILQSWVIDGNAKLDEGIISYWEDVKKEIELL